MEIDKEIIYRINKIEWFKNCGRKISLNITNEITYAKDIDSVKKYISSTRWENIGIEEENKLTSYLFKNHPKQYHTVWNSLVKEIKKSIIPDIECKIIRNANKVSLKNEEIVKQVKWDLIGIIMAYTYKKYFEPIFYKEILEIYECGNIPCGWKGIYPQGKMIVY